MTDLGMVENQLNLCYDDKLSIDLGVKMEIAGSAESNRKVFL